MFPLIISLVLLGLLTIDFVFVFPQHKRTWKIMATIFIGGVFFAWIPIFIQFFSDLLGVGRPVDLVIYVTCIVLVRELFISRVRYEKQQRTITELARAIAIRDAKTTFIENN